MEVDGDFANFRAVYDEMTDEVDRARYQFLPDHLANWFRTLDTTPRVASIVKRLEDGVEYQTWRDKLTRSKGDHGLNFPKEPEKALGMKLTLFRRFSASVIDDIPTFGFAFMRVGQNLNENAQNVIQQIFMPMARELRRHLEREVAAIPAADRVVALNHNSKAYTDTVEAAEKLEQTIREANDIEPDEKDQRIAEVSAARRLLQSVRVRAVALVELLRPLVEQAKTKLKDNLVGMAVTAFIGLLGTLIHFIGSLF
jgi:hypothetical protein